MMAMTTRSSTSVKARRERRMTNDQAPMTKDGGWRIFPFVIWPFVDGSLVKSNARSETWQDAELRAMRKAPKSPPRSYYCPRFDICKFKAKTRLRRLSHEGRACKRRAHPGPLPEGEGVKCGGAF